MTKPQRVLSLSVVGVALSATLAASLSAQTGDIWSETQLSSPDPERIDMVWWLPAEVWTQDSGMSESDVADFQAAFNANVIVGIVAGPLSPFGVPDYQDEATIRRNLTLVDGNGTKYGPLPDSLVAGDAKQLLQMLRPLFASLIGGIGENMHFFFFPPTDETGKRIASPSEPGAFTLLLYGEPYTFELPLCSAVPVKVCPVDGRELCGAWAYCPWHGEALRSGDSS